MSDEDIVELDLIEIFGSEVDYYYKHYVGETICSIFC